MQHGRAPVRRAWLDLTQGIQQERVQILPEHATTLREGATGLATVLPTRFLDC